MNVTATTEDLTNAAEALKLAAILDDRAPRADKARIAGWGEQIHRHHLGREDLLDVLQRFYDSPSDRAIAIGDLIAHARACRRDRTEREDDAAREDRRAAQDALADTQAVVAAVPFGPTGRKTPRLIEAESALQSVTCKREAVDALREFFDAKTEARKLAGARGAQ